MFTTSHALAPVAACIAVDLAGIAKTGERVFPPWTLPVVAIFGALPDLCTPHISLAARYASWSHTVWFLLGLVPVAAAAASFFPKQSTWRVSSACWLAAALHLATDAVSGGIAWLYPWRTDILGGTWVTFRWWLAGDALFLACAGAGLWLRPQLEGRSIAGPGE